MKFYAKKIAYEEFKKYSQWADNVVNACKRECKKKK